MSEIAQHRKKLIANLRKTHPKTREKGMSAVAKDLNSATKAEILKMLKAKGIETDSGLNKAELISLLEAAE